MDENLPAEWDQFFANGGELPDTLKALAAPVEEPAVVVPPVEVTAPTLSETVVPPSAPILPSTDHYDRLLKAQQDQADLLKQQLTDLQAKFTKATEAPAPDEATDPLGFLAHQMKSIQAKMDAMQAGTQQTQQQTAEQQQFSQFIGKVNDQVAQFKTTHADYDAAYRHLVETRTADYTDRGLSLEAAREAVGKEEMDIAAQALKTGRNPAEVAYGMAKRYGYVAPKPVVVPENKLETIKKGLETGKEVEREAHTERVTEANLREASDKELDRMVQEDWEGMFGKRKGIFG